MIQQTSIQNSVGEQEDLQDFLCIIVALLQFTFAVLNMYSLADTTADHNCDLHRIKHGYAKLVFCAVTTAEFYLWK